MQEFIEIPANPSSLARRKPLFGVAINDAWYVTQPTVIGKRFICPYYCTWKDMIKRSYYQSFIKKNPTYKGCSVVKEWLLFSNFRKWMEAHDWEGRELDKDILISGNKEYGPESCIFVSHKNNSLLNRHEAVRGEYPQGVSLRKDNGKYKSGCSVNGKQTHLGCFDTIKAAEYVYLVFKADLIRKTAHEEEAANNPKLQSALLRHAELFAKKARSLKDLP
tara:strand:- start:2656 stop:3315 length:660 start_codon:yes stop_codon:yes gene_type:complete